ncbi:MAG: hypothetical protein OXG35_07205, partial [Acidobacteria bacterium]|nr:hypothetical protein [Acidobacteriota bacterium]
MSRDPALMATSGRRTLRGGRDNDEDALGERGIRLHDYARAVNSSMAFAFNLFMPFREYGALAVDVALADALGFPVRAVGMDFEFHGPTGVLAECAGPQPTKADKFTASDVAVHVEDERGRKGVVLIEVKLSEGEYTHCNGVRSEYNNRTDVCADAEKFFEGPRHCYLRRPRHAGRDRRYWEILATEFGSVGAAVPRYAGKRCPFEGNSQQIMRNHVMALGVVQAGVAAFSAFGLVHHPGNHSCRGSVGRLPVHGGGPVAAIPDIGRCPYRRGRRPGRRVDSVGALHAGALHAPGRGDKGVTRPFRRGLSGKLLGDLQAGPCATVLRACVRDDLDVRLRANGVNLYFQGRSMGRIVGRSRVRHKLEIHHKYVAGARIGEFSGRRSGSCLVFDIDTGFAAAYAAALPALIRRAGGHAGHEENVELRLLQQNGGAAEVCCFDRQIQVPGTRRTLDILGATSVGAPVLVAIEVKRYPDNRIQDVPRQLHEYLEILEPGRAGLREDIAASYRTVCSQLRRLGRPAPDPQRITAGMPVMGLVVVSGYTRVSQLRPRGAATGR